MKVFKDDADVVIVMSQREKLTLDLLVASGVFALRDNRMCTEDDVDKFRAFRDALFK